MYQINCVKQPIVFCRHLFIMLTLGAKCIYLFIVFALIRHVNQSVLLCVRLLRSPIFPYV